MKYLVTLNAQIRSNGRQMLVLSWLLPFPFFVLVYEPSQWDSVATEVGLPFSVKSLWKHP